MSSTTAEKQAKTQFYYPLQRDACDEVRQLLNKRRIPHIFSDEPPSNATTGTYLTAPSPAPINVTASTIGMSEARKAGWVFNSPDPFVLEKFKYATQIRRQLNGYQDTLSKVALGASKLRFLKTRDTIEGSNISWDGKRGSLNGVYLHSLLSTFRDEQGSMIDFVERFSGPSGDDEDSKLNLQIGVVGDDDPTLSSSNTLSPLLISSILGLAPHEGLPGSESTTNLSSVSELTVEQSTGHIVSRTLEEGMKGLLDSQSDQSVPELPAILTISLARPKPDFFLLYHRDGSGSGKTKANNLTPVVAVAESKRNASVATKARVQLASAVHSTLVYFLVQHYSSRSFVSGQTKPDEGELPKDTFVFSVYYDVDRVAIYVNYPCVVTDRGQKYWRFRCSLFHEYKYKECWDSDTERLAFLAAMCLVRKHNTAVHTRMKLFEEPEEMKLLREGWAGFTKGWDADWKEYAKTQKAEEGDKKETEVGDKKEIQKEQLKGEEQRPAKAKAKKTEKTKTKEGDDPTDDNPTDDNPTDDDSTYEQRSK